VAHQTTFGSNSSSSYDAFLVKFNSSGALLWGTYYGGNSNEFGNTCATDASGNVYLAGNTNSSNAIATSGAHQTTFGGIIDAFIVKFDASGTRLWGTYYGGNDNDPGNSCATDGSGNVYLSGYTYSSSAIATLGAHQTGYGGSRDAFLVKFDAYGTRLWGTYYGGNSFDNGSSYTTDGSGNVFLIGRTSSTTAIATQGAHQTTLGGVEDAYLVKFDSTGYRLWGTYYGGNDDDEGISCTNDASGNVFLSGITLSTNDIATLKAHQTTIGSSSNLYDAFLVKFDGTGSTTGLELTKESTSLITLSPNPGQNQLTISGLPDGTIFDLSILNTLGQVVYYSKYLHDSESVKINLPNGIYEVIVETKDARFVQKWVVE
jgi:hypothetical protein